MHLLWMPTRRPPGKLLLDATSQPPWGRLMQLHSVPAPCRSTDLLGVVLPDPAFSASWFPRPYHGPPRIPSLPSPLAGPMATRRPPAIPKGHAEGMPVAQRAKAEPPGKASGPSEVAGGHRILPTRAANSDGATEHEKSVGTFSREKRKWYCFRGHRSASLLPLTAAHLILSHATY